MSNSDKKSISALILLLHLAENYAGIEAKEYCYFIQNVLDQYTRNNPVTQDEQDAIRTKIFSVDEKIAKLDYDSSITMMLAIGAMIAEHFLSFVKHPEKKNAWEQLQDFCTNNQLIKHTARSGIYDELDKSDVVSEILIGV